MTAFGILVTIFEIWLFENGKFLQYFRKILVFAPKPRVFTCKSKKLYYDDFTIIINKHLIT